MNTTDLRFTFGLVSCLFLNSNCPQLISGEFVHDQSQRQLSFITQSDMIHNRPVKNNTLDMYCSTVQGATPNSENCKNIYLLQVVMSTTIFKVVALGLCSMTAVTFPFLEPLIKSH